MERYDAALAIQPIWQGRQMYRESFLWMKGEGETRIPLLYHARKVLEVRTANLQTLFTEGKDYRLENGALVIPADSAMPHLTLEEYYPREFVEGSAFYRVGGGNLIFHEGSFFHQHQCVVTYTHEDAWEGPVPQQQDLPRFREKLEKGGHGKVLVYGDSISTGANSSAFVCAEPFADRWDEMVADGLRARYPQGTVELINTAVGGTESSWGVEMVADRAARYCPDLAILAFGMNDGSQNRSPETYRENMQKIIAGIRAKNPACEFILVATMLPNKEAAHRGGPFTGQQEDYLPVLRGLLEPGVILADMTSMHKFILSRKSYRDSTGNNINHPNDFLSRIYAQVVLGSMK